MKLLQFFKQHLAQNKWAVLAFTLLAVVASLWLILAQTTSMDEKVLSHVFGTMVYGFSMSGIALMAVALLPQSIQRETRILAYLLAIVVPALDMVWFYFSGWEYLNSAGEISAFFYHMLPWLCLLMIVPLLPFMRQKDDRYMQIFVVRWALLSMLASWVTGAVYGLLEGLLVGTFLLFSIEMIDWLLGLVLIWGAWLGAVATLGVMPNPEQPGEAQWAVKLGKRVFLPVLLIYMLVLMVYLMKIVFQWELPNGTVTYMVSAMMIQLVAVWILVYPSLHQPERKWEGLMRYLPLVCLPLVALMSVGLYRRFSDYGITISRVYAVALNVWFYLLILVLTLRTRQGKPLTVVLATLAIGLILLTSIPYINARDYTHRHIVRDINELLTDSVSGEVRQFDQFRSLDEWLQTLPEDHGQALASKWNYLLDTFGENDIPLWLTDTTSAQDQLWSRYTYRRLHYNVGPDTLHTQTLFDYERGSWATYQVPDGEWSMVSTSVWVRDADIKENLKNTSEIIIPIHYRDLADKECHDTICLNLHEKTNLQGLCVPTKQGNAVSFRRLRITQNTQTKYYNISESSMIFIK